MYIAPTYIYIKKCCHIGGQDGCCQAQPEPDVGLDTPRPRPAPERDDKMLRL